MVPGVGAWVHSEPRGCGMGAPRGSPGDAWVWGSGGMWGGGALCPPLGWWDGGVWEWSGVTGTAVSPGGALSVCKARGEQWSWSAGPGLSG